MVKKSIDSLKVANLFCAFQIILYVIAAIKGGIPIVSISYIFIFFNIIISLTLYSRSIRKIDILFVLITIIFLVIFASLSSNEYLLKFDFLILGFNAFLLGGIFQNIFALKFIYYLNICLNLIVFIMSVKSGFNPDFGNSIISLGTRNIVNAYLIFAIIFYLFLCYSHNRKIKISLIVLFLLNCILLYGRSGVILAILIFIYSLYKRYGGTIFTVLASLSALFFGTIYNLIVQNTRLSTGLELGREQFYKEYISFISSREFFFGRGVYDCCPLILNADSNPHNSFIYGHMLYGLFHTYLMILFSLIIILTKKKELIFFLIILYTRYMLDGIGLFKQFDFVLFSIFIYSYKSLFKR